MSHDHHRNRLKRLSVSSLIKYHSLCAMHKVYYRHNNLLDPQLVLALLIYDTWWSKRLIQPVFCRLASTQKLFRHMTSHSWNELPSGIFASSTFPYAVYNYVLYNDLRDHP